MPYTREDFEALQLADIFLRGNKNMMAHFESLMARHRTEEASGIPNAKALVRADEDVFGHMAQLRAFHEAEYRLELKKLNDACVAVFDVTSGRCREMQPELELSIGEVDCSERTLVLQFARCGEAEAKALEALLLVAYNSSLGFVHIPFRATKFVTPRPL